MTIRAKSTMVGAFLLAGLVAISLEATAGPKTLKIPLVYKGKDRILAIASPISPAVVIKVEKLADERSDTQKVGVNQEGKTPVPVTTDSDVGEFCANTVAELLRDAGVKVGEKPTLLVRGSVRRFFVIETGTYDGSVVLQLSVLRATDSQPLFEGTFEGAAKTWGRSLKAENYQEILSAALLEAVQRFTEAQGFLKALK